MALHRHRYTQRRGGLAPVRVIRIGRSNTTREQLASALAHLIRHGKQFKRRVDPLEAGAWIVGAAVGLCWPLFRPGAWF